MCAANEVAVPMGSHVANMNECGRYRCASGQHIASELTLGLYWVCIIILPIITQHDSTSTLSCN